MSGRVKRAKLDGVKKKGVSTTAVRRVCGYNPPPDHNEHAGWRGSSIIVVRSRLSGARPAGED